jgi:NADH:ubiquinone oxidoreductase subunit E
MKDGSEKVAREVKERTDADMVEISIDDTHGHITFEVTFSNVPKDRQMMELLEKFE